MEDLKMKKHVIVVGAIHIGFGFIGLILAVAAFIALNFAKGMVGGEEVPAMVLGFLSKYSSAYRIYVNTWIGRRNRSVELTVVGKIPHNSCCSSWMPEYSDRNSQRSLFTLGAVAG